MAALNVLVLRMLAIALVSGLLSAAASPTPAVALAGPALTLHPAQGSPGDRVKATATGFSTCTARNDDTAAAPVAFLWEDGKPVADPVYLRFGSATASITVPDDASPGVYSVVVLCAVPPQEATADFTVVPAVTDTTAPPSSAPASTDPAAAAARDPGSPGLRSVVIQVWHVVLAILLVLLLLAVLFTALALRARRGVRWARTHIRAVERPAAGLTAQTPVEAFPPSVAVRVEPRPDSGTHTVVEVTR